MKSAKNKLKKKYPDLTLVFVPRDENLKMYDTFGDTFRLKKPIIQERYFNEVPLDLLTERGYDFNEDIGWHQDLDDMEIDEIPEDQSESELELCLTLSLEGERVAHSPDGTSLIFEFVQGLPTITKQKDGSYLIDDNLDSMYGEIKEVREGPFTLKWKKSFQAPNPWDEEEWPQFKHKDPDFPDYWDNPYEEYIFSDKEKEQLRVIKEQSKNSNILEYIENYEIEIAL